MTTATRSGGFAAGYTARDAARLMGFSEAQVRAWVKAGFLEPVLGDNGELRFSLPDLVILRTAKELSRHVPAKKLKQALVRLRAQLPNGRPLSAVRIRAEGDRVVVCDGSSRWEPLSGQALFDFGVEEIAAKVAPLVRRAADEAEERHHELTAEDWFELGCELEPVDAERAMDSYRRALESDPRHAAARVNFGRLLHEAGEKLQAEREYRKALDLDPRDVTAAFNLGVVLEDLGRRREAIRAYEWALEADPAYADAHYNAARLYEQESDRAAAFRHLKAYKKLTDRE